MRFILILFSAVLFFTSCSNEPKPSLDFSKMTIKDINTSLKADSTNAFLYQARAEMYYNLNQIDSAILDYEKATVIDPNQIDWLTKISDLYLFKGKSEKARQALDEALKLEPNNTDVHLKMGMVYMFVEDNLKSFEHINLALSIDPNMENAYFYKSLNYIEVGDTVRAIEELQKAVEKKPDYMDALIQLGLLHDAQNDTIARAYYKNALQIDSSNAFARYDLALHYQNQEEFGKAIDQYLYLINNIDSSFSTAFHNIGFIYLLYSNDLDTAISYFNKAIEIDFNYSDAYANKGYALELQEKYTDAFIEYQTALKITPDHIASQKGIKRISKFIKNSN